MFNLLKPKGASKRRKIVGRGPGSGLGKTSGRGQKGQKARNTSPRLGFEGGQTPLYRRLPRKGFSNSDYKLEYAIVNLGDIDKKFKDGQVVNYDTLLENKLIKKKNKKIKILSNGKLTKKVSFEVSKISKSAESLVIKIGCTIQLV
ncbi:50S ribosomal protein L15 [Borreliella burgdorferi]|uniref:Large ribosomal subunit protein uL15 n=3 Tax=Borreliella burgdorferi TaxID=139 RepID=RL15_BORBU|nr:50S ribosomal protein L15 [Borreliella burgdorferi]B7J262.1 RecName: Full=Large ribosomal subunit protein uL15; AltName: Full=50S ribosomal protein L15 [Borreliella burgdorferi ZS7]O51450.1 RecName: Full=Large ribosomal subunit protein uL15; AltName: Full=50S ribosomal protein L15 [Borreliella burgdorferi B31]8FMW_AN Chain AN, 50S ribosomal protein L15 [Borreliella burgdorferi B31]8FN2_N Chain N, 50S ribosomal protein L15 [Borreliella burgdorferi B31]AGS66506.1 50S ribosomal protein L15 [Bo